MSKPGPERPVLGSVELKDAMGKRRWQAYHLTPLYQFNPMTPAFAETMLRRLRFEYSRSTGVTEEGVMSGEEDVRSSRTRVHLLSLHMEELRNREGSGIPGISFEMAFTKGKTETTSTFQAILIPSQTPTENAFSSYPLLLLTGSVTISRLFTAYLETRFDTHCSEASWSHRQLAETLDAWARGVFPLYVSEEAEEYLELVFKMPAEIAGASSLTLTFPYSDAHTMWSSIPDKSIPHAFLSSIRQHVHAQLSIHLEACSLGRVSTSHFHLSSKGKVKILPDALTDETWELLESLFPHGSLFTSTDISSPSI